MNHNDWTGPSKTAAADIDLVPQAQPRATYLQSCTVTFGNFGSSLRIDRNETTGRFHCPKCDRSYKRGGFLQRHTQMSCLGGTASSSYSTMQSAHTRAHDQHARSIPDTSLCLQQSDHITRSMPENRRENSLEQHLSDFERIHERRVERDQERPGLHSITKDMGAMMEEEDESREFDHEWYDDALSDDSEAEVERLCVLASPSPCRSPASVSSVADLPRMPLSTLMDITGQICPSPIPSLLYPESDEELERDDTPPAAPTCFVREKSICSSHSVVLQQPTPPRSIPPESPGSSYVQNWLASSAGTRANSVTGMIEESLSPEASQNLTLPCLISTPAVTCSTSRDPGRPVPRPRTGAFLSKLISTPGFQAFGCRTEEDLDVLALLGSRDGWLFLRKFLGQRYGGDVENWDVLQAGFEARAASLRAARSASPALIHRVDDLQPREPDTLYMFLEGLKRPLGRHIPLFYECSLHEAADLDRLLLSGQTQYEWLREELVQKGLTWLEWVVLSDGLAQRRVALLAALPSCHYNEPVNVVDIT